MINKWAKIDKIHSEVVLAPSDLKSPSNVFGSQLRFHHQLKKVENNSFRTADETLTFDSSLPFQHKQKITKVDFSKVKKELVTKPLSYSSKISYLGSRKLVTSNSSSDLVRKKRDGGMSIPQDFEENKNSDDKCLGVSVEELFNPLATHSGQFCQVSRSIEKNNATHEKLSYEKRLELNNSYKPRSTVHSPEECCDNCMEMNQKLQEFMQLTEYVKSRKDTTCEYCQKVITTTLGEVNSIQVEDDLHCHHHISDIIFDSILRDNPTNSSLPVPIQSLHQDRNPHNHVGESIALMESSQRLFDFKKLHKTRITQLTQDKESKQKRLYAKLSDFTSMCQIIRKEMCQTKTGSTGNAEKVEHSESKNTYHMLLQLEAEIELLKTQPFTTCINEPQTSIFQGTEVITTRRDLLLESDVIPSSKNHNDYINSNDDFNSDFLLYSASDVASCLSDSETSHISQGLMFSIDDEF